MRTSERCASLCGVKLPSVLPTTESSSGVCIPTRSRAPQCASHRGVNCTKFLKKTPRSASHSGRVGHPFFSKERNVLAFFCVLYKRAERFLRSFAFFIKERNFFAFFSVLYKRMAHFLRSFTFFIKERNILFGFISHTQIANLAKKRM